MKTWLKISILAAIVLAVLAAILIKVPLSDYKASGYTANTGEVTSSKVVGQTFKATENNLSKVAVMFATYSGRDNTRDIYFTLREFEKPTKIIRQAKINAGQLGDNQLHRFSFRPIENSAGKTYIFLIKSPQSVKGNAVTVDIDKRDPYHFGSAYIITDVSAEKIPAEKINSGGKVDIDTAFATYYQVPLWQASIAKAKDTYTYLKESWHEKRSLYGIWTVVVMQALILIGICWWTSVCIDDRKNTKDIRRQTVLWLAILTVLAIITRLYYAVELPLTNDEGNYLYDARTLLQGKLAGGDGYVKAPLVVAWIALWQLIGGQTIIAGRLASVVISALTLWPVFTIAKELWGRKAGLTAATAWALLGVTTVFGIYVHTQPFSIFWGAAGIAVLLVAIRHVRNGTKEYRRQTVKNGYLLLFLTGLILGAGVVSRKSILALGLSVLFTLLLSLPAWNNKIKGTLTVGLGFIIVISIFLTSAWLVYGPEGFWEATGYNSAEDGINAVEKSQLDQVRAYSLRGMTPFFRESMPLIMLSILGLGFAGEILILSILKRFGTSDIKSSIKCLLQKTGWIIPLLMFFWAWSFFKEYEGTPAMYGGMWWLWWAILAVIIIFIALPARQNKKQTTKSQALNENNIDIKEDRTPKPIKSIAQSIFPHSLTAWLLPTAWLGGLIIFYLNWIKFHANYIGEFLPPLVLMSALAFPEIVRRLAHPYKKTKILRAIAMLGTVAVLFWALFVSGFVTYMYEHTGTFDQDALREAAAWAEDNIPQDEPIFTGAAAVPYLSGHHTALDIAHPRWYAYEFTRTDTERLNTFLPPAEKMLQAYRQAEWFLLEKQTGFSFLMEYSEIEAGLNKDWKKMHGIANGSNTLTFYKRK